MTNPPVSTPEIDSKSTDDFLAEQAEAIRALARYQKEPIPADIRWVVWERDDFTCHYCGARSFLSVDHIMPERHGGPMTPANLVTACQRCNSRKGTRDDTVFEHELIGQRPVMRLINTGPNDREVRSAIMAEAFRDLMVSTVWVPGFASVPMSEATSDLLAAADASLHTKILALEQKRRDIRRMQRLTAPFPGRTVWDLFMARLIPFVALFRDDTPGPKAS